MTWILGTPTPFGYALGISDIQVTFRDGSTRDCLQKIYNVGPFIALGFSGSVSIGFGMVSTLAQLLRPTAPDHGWIPTEVAKWWPADAQRVFAAFPEEERQLGRNLILLASHLDKKENQLAPRTEVYTFLSPNFKAIRAKPLQVVTLGSGNGVRQYVSRVRQINRNIYPMLQGEVLHPGGMGSLVARSLTRELQDTPTKGISPHLHIFTVRLGRIEMSTNDVKHLSGPTPIDFTMPPVAHSYGEFLSFSNVEGVAAECAVC